MRCYDHLNSQICGDLCNVRDALIQVINRLKINHFSRKGLFSSSSSASSHQMAINSTHGSMCTGRSFEPRSHGHYSQVVYTHGHVHWTSLLLNLLYFSFLALNLFILRLVFYVFILCRLMMIIRQAVEVDRFGIIR